MFLKQEKPEMVDFKRKQKFCYKGKHFNIFKNFNILRNYFYFLRDAIAKSSQNIL